MYDLKLEWEHNKQYFNDDRLLSVNRRDRNQNIHTFEND